MAENEQVAPDHGAAAETPAPSTDLHDTLANAFDRLGIDEFDPFGSEPTSDGAPDKEEQPRDEKGKFAHKQSAQPAEEPETAEAPEEQPEAPPEPAPPVVDDAPARFSAEAKEAWKGAPKSLRNEVKRAMGELETGIRGYQQRYAQIAPFEKQLAQRQLTVADYMKQASELENILRSNPAQGVRTILNNLKSQGASIDIEDVLLRAMNPQEAEVNEVQQLQQKMQMMEQGIQKRDREAQQRAAVANQQQAARRELQMFQASGQAPRLQELWPEMIKLLRSDFIPQGAPQQRLLQAYKTVEQLKPAPTPPQAPPAPSQQPQRPQTPSRAAKSVINGAPSNGADPTIPRHKDPADTVRAAFDRFGL